MKRVGIPRGLYYYKYSTLWETFFKALGAEVIVSDITNKNVFINGINACVSEACLPIKVYFGHVMNLIGKVDYIFMPRFTSISRNQYICPEIGGVPDMIRSSIKIMPAIIDVEVNLRNSHKNAWRAAFRTGEYISDDVERIRYAYKTAVRTYKYERQVLKSGVLLDDFHQNTTQLRVIKKKSTLFTVAILGHSYTVYDSFVNMELINKLKGYGIGIVTLDMLDYLESKDNCMELDKRLFWDYGTRAYGGTIQLLESGEIDGIIVLSSFGCGVDCFIDELVENKIRQESDLPFMKLVLDEHSGEAGFCTRLEAFVDMIMRRKLSDTNISTSR